MFFSDCQSVLYRDSSCPALRSGHFAGFVKTSLLPIPSFRVLSVHGMLGHTIKPQLRHVCKTVFSVPPVIETDCFHLRASVENGSVKELIKCFV